jgi:hypothetical protein
MFPKLIVTTINKNINATCKVLDVSWAETKDCRIFYIPVSKHFSFAKKIHPPDRCGMSSWLNSMIITQVHLVLGRIKGHTKMCSFVTTQCHRCLKFWGSVQLTCWLQEHPLELLSDKLMFNSLPEAASNIVLENLAVHPTGLTTTDHI